MDLNEFANNHEIKYFLISFTDILGVNRSKLVPKRAISAMQKDGAGFAGFAAYLDLSPADSDMFAIPDTDSLIVLPWNKEIAWVAADLYLDGNPIAHAPRNVLKKMRHKIQDEGYQLKTGVECEFILLSNDGDKIADLHDNALKPCYEQESLLRRYSLISRICEYMEILGWEPYQNDHEDGNGQFEMNWGYADCLTTADRHTFFKFMVKSLAEEEGLKATFMPKPDEHITGNGCHIHFSLWNKKDENIFVDTNGELGLSQLAYHFLGGIIQSAAALSAITNPSINSYKRLHAKTTRSGATWSPNTISYTGNNRTHMIRIPDHDRFELRLPDGATNPYLMPAALIGLGINGMKNSLSPGEMQENDNCLQPNDQLPKLPADLNASITALKNSKIFLEQLGEEFITSYAKIKQQEIDLYSIQVSDWERDFYLNI